MAANDLIALGAYRAIKETGRRVGLDISVTGYNDIALLDLMHPPMTSVRVPYRRLGVEAARKLVSMMGEGGNDGPAMTIQLAPTLSVRGSTVAR